MLNDIAWAAGLFEGEGTIVLREHRRTKTRFGRIDIGVSLTSTDEDVVRSFCRVVGCGKVYGPYQYGAKRKPFWKWNLDNREQVTKLLNTFHPLMHSRRRSRIEEVLIASAVRDTEPFYEKSRKGVGGRPRKTNGVEYCVEKQTQA